MHSVPNGSDYSCLRGRGGLLTWVRSHVEVLVRRLLVGGVGVLGGGASRVLGRPVVQHDGRGSVAPLGVVVVSAHPPRHMGLGSKQIPESN